MAEGLDDTCGLGTKDRLGTCSYHVPAYCDFADTGNQAKGGSDACRQRPYGLRDATYALAAATIRAPNKPR